MRSRHVFKSIASILGLTWLLSCSQATTQITGSWKDPGARSYKDFFVIVLSTKPDVRKTLEYDIAYRLKKEGSKTEASLEVFPNAVKPDTPDERAAAVEKIQNLGHDGIITVSLVKKEETARYMPGAVQYAPTNIGYGTGYNNQPYNSAAGPGYYNSFGTYYNYNYATYAQDSYYETENTYFLETNLYDSKSAKLVWSAQSATFNPLNLEVASHEFSGLMVAELKRSGLITKGKK